MDKKEQIKNSISILDVASLYLDLKPAGKYYKALCPFHVEKTPSFYINPQKNNFVCYGCNEYGDIFTLVEKMEKLDFPGAMDFLIDRFNLKIDKTVGKFSATADLKKINRIALEYFQALLRNRADNGAAIKYLEKRKVSRETVKVFGLGYAQNSWDGLARHLQQKSIPVERALTAGLLKKKGDRVYDTFKGRLMFPIFSETGSVIGFGGRALFDDQVKYLNTPETPLFSKGRTFFGFNLSKPRIQESRAAIIVEGYFDLLALYQAGIQNVIAPLGTALTQDQIYMLKRFADKIYLFFDNDPAGLRAMIRAVKLAVPQAVVPHIISLSDVKDPDEFIVAHGPERFRALLAGAQEGFTYLLNYYDRIYNLSEPGEKIRACREVMGILADFSDPIIKNHYQQMAADFFSISTNQLEQYRRKNLLQENQSIRRMDIPVSERVFIEALLALHKRESRRVVELAGNFNPQFYTILVSSKMIRALLTKFSEKNGKFDDIAALKKEFSDPEKALFIEMMESSQSLTGEEVVRNLKSSLENFRDRFNRLQMTELTRKIKEAHAHSDQKRIRELMVMKNKLRSKLFRRNG